MDPLVFGPATIELIIGNVKMLLLLYPFLACRDLIPWSLNCTVREAN